MYDRIADHMTQAIRVDTRENQTVVFSWKCKTTTLRLKSFYDDLKVALSNKNLSMLDNVTNINNSVLSLLPTIENQCIKNFLITKCKSSTKPPVNW